MTSVGAGGEGEVEDYYVRINRNPHQNPANRFDVNDDKFVSAIDVLQVINHINQTGGGPLPINFAAPPYLDVDGNASVDPMDVLALITYINNNLIPGGEGIGAGGGEGEGEGEGSGNMWIPAPIMGSPRTSEPMTIAANASIETSENVSDDVLSGLLANYNSWVAI